MSEKQTPVIHLAEMIEQIEFGMLTHEDNEGNLVSRPMTAQLFEQNILWFFASDDSLKSKEIGAGRPVNVSFAEPKKNHYVSLSGQATLNHDRQKMEELWKPALKPWFPDGLADPNICLIRVDVDRAEYWDASKGKMVQFLNLLQAFTTGKRVEKLGEHENIKLHS